MESKEKTGVELKGVKAINPARQKAGMDDVEIPIFISDYVLAGYGTGAIMAVPAHDERDYDFANTMNAKSSQNNAEETQKDAENSATSVLSPRQSADSIKIIKVIDCESLPCSQNGKLINSDQFDGMDSEEAKEKITEFVGGKMTATYRLRD